MQIPRSRLRGVLSSERNGGSGESVAERVTVARTLKKSLAINGAPLRNNARGGRK